MKIPNGIRIAAAVVVIVLLGAFIFTVVAIRSGVREASDTAVAEYGGDRVTALMTMVDSPRHTLTTRNRAVWALGQLGDPRALPALERHRTGRPCDHAHEICQYEIDKAIRACRGSVNVTAFLWR